MCSRRCARALTVLTAVTLGIMVVGMSSPVDAQFPTQVTTFHAPPVTVVAGQPVVTFTPQRAGLLGLRTVYRPEVGILLPPSPTPVLATTTFFAPAPPAIPVTSAPSFGVPTTTFFAPAVPVTTFSVPSTPVTTFSVPVTGAPVPVTTFMVPAAPTIPTQGFSNFLPGY